MSREIKNILLTGGTGTLGSELKPLLQEAGYNVLSPTHEEMPIECMIAVGDFGRYNKVDLILHCAAYTDVKGAEKKKNREKVIETNIFAVQNLKVLAKRQLPPAKTVYISTDYVYKGDVGGYSTKSPTVPTTFYGWSKLAGESFLEKEDLVIRTSFCKRGTWGKSKNMLPKVFKDIYTSKDWVDVIAPKIVKSLKRKGVIQIGTDRKTLESLAVEDYPEVEIIDSTDVKLGYEYPKDCSFM
tara:strand:+ start:4646 stop:5368 length:723 start_codon:yes stop_codon:yes gene_type:complete